ncbi:unnamed protein product [Schistosoma curassoni]|nr:unnamed protein product [Schistosoma curassoni]
MPYLTPSHGRGIVYEITTCYRNIFNHCSFVKLHVFLHFAKILRVSIVSQINWIHYQISILKFIKDIFTDTIMKEETTMNITQDDQINKVTNMSSSCLNRIRSRTTILIIVLIALLLDNVLLTTIVPIIPKLLLNKELIETNCTHGNCSHSTIHTIDNYNPHIKIGILFTVKPLVQFLVNPFIGPITNRIGYSIPMFTGFILLFISIIIFAFETNFYILLIARAIQGVGSACSSVSGMGMLATYYIDETERGRAFAIALSGLAIGLLIGAPYGGITYQFISKQAPFLILASITVVDGILQLLVLKPKIQRESQEGSKLTELLKDPYILVAAEGSFVDITVI